MSNRAESFLVGLVGDGVMPSLTPYMHEREGDVQGLRYLYRPIDLTELGLPGRAGDFSLPHAAPLADLLAGVLAAGSVTVCTQCAARRNMEADDLITGIRIAGAATFVAEIMTEGAQALVY